jgi:alpha-ketoglutarate-dependent taurine dioxygenase
MVSGRRKQFTYRERGDHSLKSFIFIFKYYFMPLELARTVPARTGDFPLLYESTHPNIDWQALLQQLKSTLAEELLEYGAILLRGLPLHSAEDFNKAFKLVFEEPLEYTFRTSPREDVGNNIYTSTSHPADQVIHFHTENSYSTTWNQIIAFFCLQPPAEGGETPIADERRILASLPEECLARFREKGIRYIRNTMPGVGLNWQTIYQTKDKSVAEAFLREKKMQYEWVSDDHLRTSWILPAFHNHPVTNNPLWFNHMYFGHKSLYDPVILDFLGETNLPFATYYGDGTEVEEEVIQAMKAAYEKHKIIFKWQQGDLLLMDNMLFSHGRNPFMGDRKILVAMARPVQYSPYINHSQFLPR